MERKLKAVIDTNLFISGLFARDSLSAQLQDLWINQETVIKVLDAMIMKNKMQGAMSPLDSHPK